MHHYLTHEEADKILNDLHGGSCDGHLSRLATSHKILHVGYFWPSIFKDYIEGIKKFHPCQPYMKKMCVHLVLLHLVIVIGPFTKWGIDFKMCHPTLDVGHKYIIVAIDCFTKWVKAMSTFTNESKMAMIFIFNHIIACFKVPKEIVVDHMSHFQITMMTELSTNLGFK